MLLDESAIRAQIFYYASYPKVRESSQGLPQRRGSSVVRICGFLVGFTASFCEAIFRSEKMLEIKGGPNK
jgi:hypothetical protein